jgi:hypothetical protein
MSTLSLYNIVETLFEHDMDELNNFFKSYTSMFGAEYKAEYVRVMLGVDFPEGSVYDVKFQIRDLSHMNYMNTYTIFRFTKKDMIDFMVEPIIEKKTIEEGLRSLYKTFERKRKIKGII